MFDLREGSVGWIVGINSVLKVISWNGLTKFCSVGSGFKRAPWFVSCCGQILWAKANNGEQMFTQKTMPNLSIQKGIPIKLSPLLIYPPSLLFSKNRSIDLARSKNKGNGVAQEILKLMQSFLEFGQLGMILSLP
jgi:hypothetical protein